MIEKECSSIHTGSLCNICQAAAKTARLPVDRAQERPGCCLLSRSKWLHNCTILQRPCRCVLICRTLQLVCSDVFQA